MNVLTGVFSLVTFILLLITSNSQGAPQGDYRNRNLIPFPRVGRGGRDVSLDIASPDYPTKFDEFASPKVRRTGTKTMSTGLWFGPRLGRIQKRKENYVNEAMRYLLLRDLASYKNTPKYTPRLGRESEELFGDVNQNNLTNY